MALLMLLMLLLMKTKLPQMETMIGRPLVVAALLPLSELLWMALLLLQMMMMKLEGVLLLLLSKLL